MIHDEICTYKVAKLAKEKGFNEYEACNHIYEDDEQWYTLTTYTNAKGIDWSKNKFTVAPTQSLLQRWMREEKGIHIEVYVDWEDSIEYNMIRYSWKLGTVYRVGNHDIGGYYKNESEVYFDTYELALEDAELYCLKKLL